MSSPRSASEVAAHAARGDANSSPTDARVEIDYDGLEQALDELLSLHPDALVAAARADGVFVDMPATVPLKDHVVAQGRSGLDLVTKADFSPLLAAWDRAQVTGVGRCVVHLVDEPERPVALHFLDLQRDHGVYLLAFVPTDPSDDAPVARGPEIAQAPPRFANVKKDQRAVLLDVDEALTQILGWSAEEMIGRRTLDFIHEDDHGLAVDNWMEMLQSPGPGRRVRLRHQRKEGSWVWFEVTNHNLFEDPDHGCAVSTMVDISEEMATQEALRAREQLLDRLAEAIPLGLLQIDADRKVVYTNDRLHEIVGLKPAPTVQAQLATVVERDKSTLKQAIDSVLGGGDSADIEVELQLPRTRELRLCALNLRPLGNAGQISGAIASVADVTDSARMREELKRKATFDELTGCYNRASILPAIEAIIDGSGEKTDLAVSFVDLDHFKPVNDHLGHAAGDELLKIVASRLQAAVRDADLVARIGGDEFLVVCPGIGGPERAMKLAERLSAALAGEVGIAGSTIELAASIGVAWSSRKDVDADALIAQADDAMYDAKSSRDGRPKLAAA
jgi:diguanylate cyclase (GGDEF)-like protein/PAS domain S-box-containing protein